MLIRFNNKFNNKFIRVSFVLVLAFARVGAFYISSAVITKENRRVGTRVDARKEGIHYPRRERMAAGK